MVSRQPYDQETGERNCLSKTVKKLGIDAEMIKFKKEEEDFGSF